MQQTTNQSKTTKSNLFRDEIFIPDLSFEQKPFERIIPLHELHTLISSKYGDVCEPTLQNIDQHCNKKTTESDDMSVIDKGIERMLSSVGVVSVQRLDKIIRRLSDGVTIKEDVKSDYIKVLYAIKFQFFQYSFNTLLESRNSHAKQLINAKFINRGYEKLFQILLSVTPSYDTDLVDLRPLQVNINHVFDEISNSRVKRN
jgi:hypothetical protein